MHLGDPDPPGDLRLRQVVEEPEQEDPPVPLGQAPRRLRQVRPLGHDLEPVIRRREAIGGRRVPLGSESRSVDRDRVERTPGQERIADRRSVEIGLERELALGGCPPEPLGEGRLRPADLERRVLQPARHANRPAAVAEEALQLSLDGASCKRREPYVPIRIETGDRLDETDRRHLLQILPGDARMPEPAGEHRREPPIPLEERVAGVDVARRHPTEQNRILDGEEPRRIASGEGATVVFHGGRAADRSFDAGHVAHLRRYRDRGRTNRADPPFPPGLRRLPAGNVRVGGDVVDIVDRSTIESLASWDRPPCVSIYLPVHRTGREMMQDPIRLKNLLERAHDDLERAGTRAPEATRLLTEVRGLLDDAGFWQHQEAGLAVFAAPGRTDRYRVPVAFEEHVVVGPRFHLKPLWPAVNWDDRFAVLAVSEHEVRLLSGNRDVVSEIDLPPEIPTTLAEALWFEETEKQLQSRAIARGGRGRVVATFHGHGIGEERDQDRLRRFLRAVDAGIHQLIDADLPLVLAGAERPVAFFREVTEHRNVLEGFVPGNPEERSPAELHDRAWTIARPAFEQTRDQDADALLAAGDLRAATVESIVPAAIQGRVRTLFVPASLEVWGHADASGVTEHDAWMPGDRDLVDLAVVETWRHGGRVYVVAGDEVPGHGPLAAHFRF